MSEANGIRVKKILVRKIPPLPGDNAGGRNPGGRERKELRAANAFDLRMQGWTYQEIADHFGVSIATVYTDVDTIRASLREHSTELADRERDTLVGQCHQIIARMAPFLTDPDVDIRTLREGRQGTIEVTVEKHDAMTKAATVILKAHERLAKFLGLDAPEKATVDVTNRFVDDGELVKRVDDHGAAVSPLVTAMAPKLEVFRARGAAQEEAA